MTSILTPFVDGEAIDLGQLWRKQVLKFKKIRLNDGAELDINADLANEVVQAYNEGAFDQTPFVLVDGDNGHPNGDENNRYKPENFRGDIRALEVTADGVDMIMDPSSKGAELLRENPRLGVSARIVPNYRRSDGKTFRAAIEHVAGTLNPVVTGMRPWQAVNLSSTDTGEVIDLSTEEYEMPDETTEPHTEAAETVETETPATVAALLDQLTDEQLTELASEELTDEELALLGVTNETETEKEPAVTEPEKVPALAGADLSTEAKAAIDLANSNAKAANDRTAALETQLANERADRECDALKAAGVPPAMVDLARPALATTGQAIDLSNGKSTDSVAIIRGLLNESRGRIDLSKEKGHGDMTAEETKAHAELMDKWAADSFPQLRTNK